MNPIRLSAYLLACTVCASYGQSIFIPSIVSTSSENAYGGQTFAYALDNSGLTSPVNSGDSLAYAMAVNHIYGGYEESYVTEGGATDYFVDGLGASALPTFVLDLGTDSDLANILLWQYQNDGGGNPGDSVKTGNFARTIELRFNSASQGSSNFFGASTSITLQPVVDGDGISGNDLGGTNSAQNFPLSAAGRYVQLTLTDNYRGFQGITDGGERVGLGELRFNGTAIPEPTGAALLAAGGLVLAIRRRRQAL